MDLRGYGRALSSPPPRGAASTTRAPPPEEQRSPRPKSTVPPKCAKLCDELRGKLAEDLGYNYDGDDDVDDGYDASDADL